MKRNHIGFTSLFMAAAVTTALTFFSPARAVGTNEVPAGPFAFPERLTIGHVHLGMTLAEVEKAAPTRNLQDLKYDNDGKVCFIAGDELRNGRVPVGDGSYGAAMEVMDHLGRAWARGHADGNILMCYRIGADLLVLRNTPNPIPDSRDEGTYAVALATSNAWIPYRWGHNVIAAEIAQK